MACCTRAQADAITTVTALTLAALDADRSAEDAIINGLGLEDCRAVVAEFSSAIARAYDQAAQAEARQWADEQAALAGDYYAARPQHWHW